MSIRSFHFGLILWCLSLTPSAAETLVLVQGYLGSDRSWRESGVTTTLHNSGWRDAGHLTFGPNGVRLLAGRTSGNYRFYTINLVTEAPLIVQADSLARYIGYIAKRHPKEPIKLIGHSAGGVVARLCIVRHQSLPIETLITIASPHLGTETAEYGSLIGNSPLGWVTPFMGAGTINRSQYLYKDLARERPGNLLGWLNRQSHPVANYVSVVRVKNGRRPDLGDSVSQGWSQDMNSVPALRGHAKTVFSSGDHKLRFDDGPLLVNLLRSTHSSAKAN